MPKHQGLVYGTFMILGGFTLIELLVVIAIIGLLASVVMASLNSARAKGRVANAAAQLRQITTALNFYLDANGVYPCFDHTWDDTREKVWSAPYIGSWPKNPWNGYYHWEHNCGAAGVSISMSGIPDAEAQALDKAIDDNNLSTGLISYCGAGRIEYRAMDQTIPFVDCH